MEIENVTFQPSPESNSVVEFQFWLMEFRTPNGTIHSGGVSLYLLLINGPLDPSHTTPHSSSTVSPRLSTYSERG